MARSKAVSINFGSETSFPVRLCVNQETDSPKLVKLRLFRLFFGALRHEIGSSIEKSALISQKCLPESCARTINAVKETFEKLRSLVRNPLNTGDEELVRVSGTTFKRSACPKKYLDSAISLIDEELNLLPALVSDFRVTLLDLKQFSESSQYASIALQYPEFAKSIDLILHLGIPLSNQILGTLSDNQHFEVDFLDLPVRGTSGTTLIGFAKSVSSSFPISLTLTDGSDLDNLFVHVSPFFCSLIFRVLLSNANRAVEDVQEERRLIILSAEVVNDRLEIRIQDTGCGMPQELYRALNSGSMISTRNSSDDQIHGFGLNYARELSRLMHGDLYIEESVENNGTTVVFELPISID